MALLPWRILNLGYSMVMRRMARRALRMECHKTCTQMICLRMGWMMVATMEIQKEGG